MRDEIPYELSPERLARQRIASVMRGRLPPGHGCHADGRNRRCTQIDADETGGQGLNGPGELGVLWRCPLEREGLHASKGQT